MKNFLTTLLFILFAFLLNAQITIRTGAVASSKKIAPPLSYADPTLFSYGSTANGTTTVSPTYPASITSGMDILIFVSTKFSENRPSSPSGFRRIAGPFVPYNGSNGSDQGAVVITLYHKTASGGESGTVPITITNGNTALATIIVIDKDATAKLNYSIARGQYNIPNTTSISIRSFEKLNIKNKDHLLILTNLNTDAYAYVSEAVSMLGQTFTTVNAELFENPTTQGNDQEQIASWFKATSSGQTDYVTYTFTSGGSSAAPENPMGAAFFVNIRESNTDQVWWPSGYVVDLPADYQTQAGVTDGGNIFNGHRASFEGPDIATARYVLTTKNGRGALKYIADLTDVVTDPTKPNRRTEDLESSWQPQHPIGTQMAQQLRWETDAYPNNPYQEVGINANSTTEWVMFQNHTGTAPGGPWPLNSPIFYLGWSYNGQTGWTNTGSASVGSKFIIVNKAGNVRHLTSVSFAPLTTYRIEYFIQFDIASGDPAFRVEVNDVVVFEDYVNKTVFEASDIPVEGSPELVGGATKRGIYHHGITNNATRATEVAAGHKGLVLYLIADKSFIIYPGDSDYIADETDDALDIFDWLDTSLN